MRKPLVNATVFLGGGRIAAALIAGLRLGGYKQPIIVHDRHPDKLLQLRKKYKIVTESDLHRAVAKAGLLIVAVRPGSVRELLNEIGCVDRHLLAVSVAAGIPLTDLRAGLGPPVRWTRAMPSPASRIGRGLIALTFPPELPVGDRRRVINFFKNVGSVVEVPETEFDIFTATYSCSHGYHALATLAGAAERLGLDRSLALTAAAHALADGVLSWREGDVDLEALMEEAATPGGIAATVMATMDEGNYEALVEKSLRAGVAKARENARLTHEVKASSRGRSLSQSPAPNESRAQASKSQATIKRK
jgi:pyrroline-5-carboxylate reductase